MKIVICIVSMVFIGNLLTAQELESPVKKYLDDRGWHKERNPVTNQKDSVRDLFNPKMLNILFANKVGTAFGGSNDLSLQKFHASIDADDKSIALGVNFDSRRKNEEKKLGWIISAGVKLKAINKFATVFKNGEFQQNSVGLTGKLTWIGRGIISFTDNDTKQRKDAFENNRKQLEKKYNKAAAKFNKESLKTFKTNNDDARLLDTDIKSNRELLTKKRDKAYIAMAKEEIKYLESAKMYSRLWDHWASVEFFVPLGTNEYKVTPEASIPLDTKNFYALDITASYTSMWQWPSGVSLFLNGEADIKNNNNILIDGLSKTPFQTTVQGSNGTTIVTKSEDGYITEYDDFINPSLKIEPSFFFLKNTIGISPAVEFNVGTYDAINWKIGIPISLKDKDGKPKVNFELQWKEVNSLTKATHLIGVSANFLFGDLIN